MTLKKSKDCLQAMAHTLRRSESIRLQFRQFEHMLKRVNQQVNKYLVSKIFENLRQTLRLNYMHNFLL